ncbi:MAG: hypothetical protein K2Y39_15305, partial [Candidatus Obscuribacterales bacterium]|nr:hypothetical protein [Candidatus Obscuribacterales bacterium]
SSMAGNAALERAVESTSNLVKDTPDTAANARDEVNRALDTYDFSPREYGNKLQEQGILGDVVLFDSANLDTDQNGEITYPEALDAAVSGGSDALTRSLGEYLSEQISVNYEPFKIPEVADRADESAETPVDESNTDEPVEAQTAEQEFDPKKYSNGEIEQEELAYANTHFDELDGDGNGFITAGELDQYSQRAAGTISEQDAGKLLDLKENVGDLEEKDGDDEFLDENDGITRADLHKAAEEMAQQDNENSAETGAEATTAEEVLTEKTAEEKALDTLGSKDASTEDQLQAIKTLVEAGQTTATITDADGTSMTVRLEVQPISEGSDRSFVHMFAVDESGRETVVLRAVSDGEGFAQQRDADGNLVSYVGSRWKERHPESIFGE